MADLEGQMVRAPLGRTAQTFIHDGDDQHAVEGSEQRSRAALDPRAAQDHGDDDLQFQSRERAGADGAVSRGEGERGEKTKQTNERVNLQNPARHRDSGVARGNRIAAQHQNLAEPAGAIEPEPEEDEGEQDQQRCSRDLTKPFVGGNAEEGRLLQIAHHDEAESAIENHRAERGDDRGHVEPGDERAVRRSEQQREGEAKRDGGPPKLRTRRKG